jgi:Flp pilus assembly pilin Flp
MLRSLLVSFAYLAGELRWKLAGQRGQTLAEYSLTLTIISVAVAGALIVFRDQIVTLFESVCFVGC